MTQNSGYAIQLRNGSGWQWKRFTTFWVLASEVRAPTWEKYEQMERLAKQKMWLDQRTMTSCIHRGTANKK